MKLNSWTAPARQLRSQLNLPIGKNPILEGQFSPFGTLALFSRHFAAPQPDWPSNVVTTGFVDYDKRGIGFGLARDGDLQRFLNDGPPPVVFTLGSAAVMQPDEFFQERLKAAQELGIRAVMLIGKADRAQFAIDPKRIHLADYAPYSQLLPHAAATVHQGGIGTLGQAFRAGKPMIIVPWGHDQPDNAERARKLGVSRTISRRQYTASRAVRELRHILDEPAYTLAARQLAANIRGEPALDTACNFLEKHIR